MAVMMAAAPQVSPAEYMEAVEALRPSAYVTMADDLPRATSDKRSRLSVERTYKVCYPRCSQAAMTNYLP